MSTQTKYILPQGYVSDLKKQKVHFPNILKVDVFINEQLHKRGAIVVYKQSG